MEEYLLRSVAMSDGVVANRGQASASLDEYYAYLKRLRLEAEAVAKQRGERWEKVKHLYKCDMDELWGRLMYKRDMSAVGVKRVHAALMRMLHKEFKEGEHYTVTTNGTKHRRWYTLKPGVCWRLAGMFLKWWKMMMERKENVTITKIMAAYTGGTRQYNVRREEGGKGPYRIDLYYPAYKIAVECDEFGHASRDKAIERERQDTITKTLGCVFFRFNPDAKGFSIDKVIRKLGDLMNTITPVRFPCQDWDSDCSDDGDGEEEDAADGGGGDGEGDSSSTAVTMAQILKERETQPEYMDPGWMDIMPHRRHYSNQLWYLTPYGEKEWPYKVPYGIYPPNGYIPPKTLMERPAGAGGASPELLLKEAIAANRYGRGPWPGLPARSSLKYCLVADCNMPGSTTSVTILGTIAHKRL